MEKNKRVVVITGDSSGIGLMMVIEYLNHGDTVIGISRHEFSMNGLTHINADIAKEEDCKQAIKEIINLYGHIDILINNAGYGISGPIEETNYEEAKKLAEVNFFGPFLLAKATLPYMRKEGQGKIINISSIASIVPIPFQAFYSAYKAGMDKLFDALRSEVEPYHIQICSVKPGDTKTNFTAKRDKEAISLSSIYHDRFLRSMSLIERDENGGMNPLKIAKVVYLVSSKKRMPYTLGIGAKDRLGAFIYRILPKRLSSHLIYKIYAK